MDKHVDQPHNYVYETSKWMNPILLRRTGQVMLPTQQTTYTHLACIQNKLSADEAGGYTEKIYEPIDQPPYHSSALENRSGTNGHLVQQTVDRALASMLQDIEQLGYTFAPELITACRQLFVVDLAELYRQIVPVLQHMVGDHVSYQPMYPDFPAEVMEASAGELYLNALLHYYYGDRPDHEPAPRQPVKAVDKLIPIGLGVTDRCIDILRDLATAKGSLSAQDKDDLAEGLRKIEQVEWVLPEHIPYKENLAFIAAILLESGRADSQKLAPYFRTATDVLRLAAGLSGLDTDLAWAKKLPQLRNVFANVYNLNQAIRGSASVEPNSNSRTAYHFRKFRRAERRLLLGLLERTVNPLEDMVLYREQWKRLGELLHPGEMRTRYPRAFDAFTALRRERSIPTTRTEIERGMKERDPAVIAKLGTRPGELARRLDALLRSQPEHTAMIIKQLEQHLCSLAVPLLLQMMAHFSHRQERRTYRVFFPKGNMGKVVAVYDRLPALHVSVTSRIVQLIRDELKRRFHDRPALGTVYIDPQLQQIPVPLSQRSASRALRALPRGSRIPMPDGDTVRLFCWWKNMNHGSDRRVDIDLSAVLLDTNWQPIETLAFYNLQEKYAVHSGDIVDAPHGASEFIDLYLSKIRQSTSARYILMQVACYTGQAMSELPECFAGFMMRDDPQAGEVYDPSTVKARFDLTVEAQQCVPLVLDLQEWEMIWLDAVPRNRSFRITAADNMTSLQMLGHAFTDLRRPMLAELFQLHAEARGTIVNRAEDADIVFALDEGVTPYQTDVILAEYL